MPYIVGAIIGAIIGYFTNWLAIKMLFRPRTEKRIAGIKIPFTPGLIPKEKKRIAKGVAESVGEHLINQESIEKSLNKPEVKVKIKTALTSKANELLNKEGSLENTAKNVLGEGYEEKISSVEDKIYKKALILITDESKQKVIASHLNKIILNKLNEKPELLINIIERFDFNNVIKQISDKLTSDSGNEFVAEKLDNILDKLKISDKAIKEYLPNRTLTITEDLIYKNKEKIASAIVDILHDEEISDKIKNTIIREVLGSLGPLVSMFGGGEAIYGKLVTSIENALAKEESQDDLCKHIIGYIHKLTEKNISDVINELPVELSVDLSVEISKKVADIISDETNGTRLKYQVIKFVSQFESYSEILEKLNIDYAEKLEVLIKDMIQKVADSEELKGAIQSGITIARKELLSYEISKDEKVKENLINSVNELFDTQYDRFIQNDLQGIIEILDIQSIVEEQINAFDVDEGEKIILGIASKELSAITWLGALLGGMLGILSPLLSSLY